MGNLKDAINGYKHKEPLLMETSLACTLEDVTRTLHSLFMLRDTYLPSNTSQHDIVNRVTSKLLVLLEKQVDDMLPAETK